MHVGEEATTFKGQESSTCFPVLESCGPTAAVNHSQHGGPRNGSGGRSMCGRGEATAGNGVAGQLLSCHPRGVNQVF